MGLGSVAFFLRVTSLTLRRVEQVCRAFPLLQASPQDLVRQEPVLLVHSLLPDGGYGLQHWTKTLSESTTAWQHTPSMSSPQHSSQV